MNSRFYWLIVVLILGSMVMGACAAPPAPPATLTPRPTAIGPGGFPLGSYRADRSSFGPTELTFSPQGAFVITLADNSRMGSYVVNGDQVVVTTDDGPCANEPATYHWELHGNTLTLKAIHDPCTDSARQASFEGSQWIKQP